jgi:hypothetical protein
MSKLPAFFAAYPDMAVEMAASEGPTIIMLAGLPGIYSLGAPF